MVQLVVANLAPASWLALLYFLPLSYAGPADAQRIDALGPQVRKYLRVSTPKVILEHVQVIDGTGAAPVPDRNVSIEGGKITAVTSGAEEAPSDGTTTLDLRGFSVMPGIVGMHNHLFYLTFPATRPFCSAGTWTWSAPSSRQAGYCWREPIRSATAV